MMSLRKAAALMDDDRGSWQPDQTKTSPNIGFGATLSDQTFRVPGLSSSEDSSGSSSSDDGTSRLRGDAPWRRRKKRYRPSPQQPNQPFSAQSPMDEAAMMETEHQPTSSVGRPAPTRRTNYVWASVLTDSVLDDAMTSQMHMYRSDRDVESYAYPGRERRSEGNAGGRRRKAVLEEGELSDNEDEPQRGDDDEDSHSDSLSIDNNVDPGEFAREGYRGRYDMEEIEDMDTNSRSALPGACAPSTSTASAAEFHSLTNEAEPDSNDLPHQSHAQRKRQRKKKGGMNRSSKGSVRNRLGKRSFDPNKARPEFDLGPQRTDEEIATAVALRLKETRSDILLRCVREFGREKVYQTLLLTEDLEEAGGLYTVDGSRRRTPGGVYFHLIKEDDQLSHEQKRRVFYADEDAEFRKEKKKRKRLAASRRLRHGSSSSLSGSVQAGSGGPVPPPEEWSSSTAPFTVCQPGPPGPAVMTTSSNLTPPHASTTSSSPPSSSTLASTEATSSGKTPNNSPRPAPLEVDDF